jgi:hypothetical protein
MADYPTVVRATLREWGTSGLWRLALTPMVFLGLGALGMAGMVTDATNRSGALAFSVACFAVAGGVSLLVVVIARRSGMTEGISEGPGSTAGAPSRQDRSSGR